MSVVWLTIPSARPDAGTVEHWKQRGYDIALWRDKEDSVRERYAPDGLVIVAPYPGYARAVNQLTEAVFELDPEAMWCVAGGDDTEPDQTKAPEEIAWECTAYFRHLWSESHAGDDLEALADCMDNGTFGVMQPTGDRWADGSIDRICGSPWMGREFCRRMYGGRGPLYEGYSHMFVDEELQAVAIKLGVLWQRRDLIHLHNHFLRTDGARDVNREAATPAHMVKWNTSEHWNQSQALFRSRKAAGFPGHEPAEHA